jgi:hypothetical protein
MTTTESHFLNQIRQYNIAETQQERDLVLAEIGLQAGLIPPPTLTEDQRRIVRYYMKQALAAQGLSSVKVRE